MMRAMRAQTVQEMVERFTVADRRASRIRHLVLVEQVAPTIVLLTVSYS